MAKISTNPKVDAALKSEDRWRVEFEKLRAIILGSGCPLTEELKWGKPCYAREDANIVLIHGFKEYCALLFMKGALMKDPAKLLVRQTENVQSGRQIRFTSAADIARQASVLKDYIREAVRVEESGLKVAYKQTAEFEMAEEFRAKLEQTPALKKAFATLTPGRQRGYLLFFSSAKQSQTRAARVEKCAPRILAGKGLDD